MIRIQLIKGFDGSLHHNQKQQMIFITWKVISLSRRVIQIQYQVTIQAPVVAVDVNLTKQELGGKIGSHDKGQNIEINSVKRLNVNYQ